MISRVFLIVIFVNILLIGCSKKTNLEIDIEELRKDGVTLLQSNTKSNSDYVEINKINSISLNPLSLKNSITFSFHVIKNKNFFYHNSNNFYEKQIIYFDNKISFVDDEANLFILDHDLKLINKFQIYKKKKYGNYLLKFSLIQKNNIIYIADNLGRISAYDFIKNSLLWYNDLNVPFISNLVIYKNSIFITNANGKLYSFNISNGSQNWSFETGTNTFKSYKAYEIILNNNILIFSNDLGLIYFINLDDQKLLSNYTLEQDNRLINNDLLQLSKFFIDKEHLYFSSNFGKIVKLNVLTNSKLWSSNYSSNLNLVKISDKLIVINEDGYLNIYDDIAGKILFSKNLINFILKNGYKGKNIKFKYIFLSSGFIHAFTNEGHIISLNSNNFNDIKINKISDKLYRIFLF
jgi:hypothetical protein